MVEEEISDGELTDLLAEVDETPSTSSRLRPSTINQPSSSAGRRHSQRIQSRASSSPNPRLQTSWVSSALRYSTKCLSCVYLPDIMRRGCSAFVFMEIILFFSFQLYKTYTYMCPPCHRRTHILERSHLSCLSSYMVRQ